MATLMTTTVTGPTQTASRYGLLSVLGAVGSSENPVAWDYVAAHATHLVGQYTTATDGVTQVTVGQPKPLDQLTGANQEVRSFTVLCSFTGNVMCDVDVRKAFDLRVERALETALLGEWSSTHYPAFNGNTGSPPVESNDVETLGGALDRVQQDVCDVAGNIIGVVHVPAVYVTQAIAANLLYLEGGRVYTAMGWPVAAGRGYGTDPVVWATPAMKAWSGGVSTTEAVSPTTNDRVVLVEQTWEIGWDSVTAAATFEGQVQGGSIEIYGVVTGP